jgi:hypothetical protein
MKKLFIGLILASSFIMSGNLTKCTEAAETYDRIRAPFELYSTSFIYLSREIFYRQVLKKWKVVIRKECEGIVNKKNLEYFLKPYPKKKD